MSHEAKIGREESLKQLDVKGSICGGQEISGMREENVKMYLELKDVLSTAQQIDYTDGSKVSTDKEKDSTDRTDEGTDDQTEGGRATQTTQTPTSTIFGDDETIAQVLLTTKASPKQLQERRDKRTEKKFKQLASDEEMARKVQEEWEGEEERKRLAEEEATNDALIRNYDDIKARIEADRLLAEKLQEEEREQFTIEERAKFLHDTNSCRTNFKPTELNKPRSLRKYKLSIKIKRCRCQISYRLGLPEDERLIKEMNKKELILLKNKVREGTGVQGGDKEKKVIRKEREVISKMIARKKNRSKRMLTVMKILKNPQEPMGILGHSTISWRMLDLGLEVERESYVALDLIRFIKQQIEKTEVLK
ncbi:hypothetical protein Tco_0491997 [Tanacetum coccineum]